jgi:NDP-sugar pyrophosphorylase family protein
MDITTIILAGGRGTRIAHLCKDVPKPLVKVNGNPFLNWLTLYLIKSGLRKFVYSAGYKSEQIEDWIVKFTNQHVSNDNIYLKVVCEDKPLGTGGAIFACLDHCDDWFIVLNGDSLALFDLQKLISLAGRSDIDGAIVGLRVDDTSRYGSLDIGVDGYLRGFYEKRAGAGLISAGIYLFRKDLIMSLHRNGQVSIETEILPELISNGTRLKVVDIGTAPFIDIGTPETLAASDIFVSTHSSMFL